MANRGTKGILFTGWKVRAIYNGADVTRRRMNPQPPDKPRHAKVEDQWVWYELGFDGDHYPPEDCRKPRYHKGDILYVKEAWKASPDYDKLPPRDIPQYVPIEYPATDVPWYLSRYRPARFMCRWMSRLWLRVTEEPTPERVRDITESEAIREGIHFQNGHGVGCSGYRHSRDYGYIYDTAAKAFRVAWSEIHGSDSWERDWVWRIPLVRTEAPHD